jgi:glutamate-1-semialdehyde 2,1-aminomutase
MELLAPIGGVYQAGTLSGNPVAMQAGLLALQKISAPDFYTTLNDTALKVVQLLNHWTLTFDHGRFSHYHWEVQGSLFWPVRKNSAIAVIRSLHDLPITLASDFFDLFAVLLSKGIYLAPNAYEVGFVSTAHAQALEDLKHRLWS